MIVVDTNLLVYLYIAGQWTEQAEVVLRREPMWTAPLLWRSEFRSTMIGLVRRQAIALEDATTLVSEAERFMAGREYAVLSDQVLRLAAASGCSAYDCEFVTLAQDLGVQLVTADREVLAAFPSTARSPDRFAR